VTNPTSKIESIRRELVALKRSIDPHISDPRRCEILRSDLDPIWQRLVALLGADETTAPLSEADEVQIGRSQAELAVLKKDGRSYEIRRITGQALEVITRLHAARGTFGEVAQLRRVDKAARTFVDNFPSTYVDDGNCRKEWLELTEALFDAGLPEEPKAPLPEHVHSWDGDQCHYCHIPRSSVEKASGGPANDFSNLYPTDLACESYIEDPRNRLCGTCGYPEREHKRTDSRENGSETTKVTK
jgi:hypothetical protein